MFIVLNPGNGSKDFTILTPWQDLFIQFHSQLSCDIGCAYHINTCISTLSYIIWTEHDLLKDSYYFS